MAKSGGVRLTTHVLLVFAVASYFVATFGDGREIERVKTHAARLAAERDSIHQVVDWLSRQQNVLRQSAQRHASRATRLRDSVVTLEQLRQEARFTVRRLRKTEDLQARLDQVFPEMADSRWGLTTIPLNESDTLGIEYFVGLLNFFSGSATGSVLFAQISPGKGNQPFPPPLVGPPKFSIGNAFDSIPGFLLGRVVDPG